MRYVLPLLLLLPITHGCRSYESIGGIKIDTGELEDSDPDTTDDSGPDTDTDTTDTGEPDPVWDTATLSIISPSSGDFIPMEEEGEFEAVVLDTDGNTLDWDAIDWSSSADSDWAPSGASFTSQLEVGEHDITASTRLPNGDRLAMTVGDVLVQSVYAGTYTGTIYVEITIEYGGTPYTVSCAGATTITVDLEGEAAVGDSSCLVSLMGYDMDMALNLDAENDDGELSGEMAVDMMLFDVGIEASGSLSEEGELYVEFADDVYGYADIAGNVDASRISRDTDLSD